MNYCFLEGCPDDYESGVYGLQCYRIIAQENTWSGAKELCEADNAHLADLEDPDERSAVHNYAKCNKQDLGFFIRKRGLATVKKLLTCQT